MAAVEDAEISLDTRSTVLVFCAFYLPGFLGGGPTRTIANLVESLGDEFEFLIVSIDRDLGDPAAYDSVCHNSWNIQGKAKVFYVKPGVLGILKIASILYRHIDSIVYLNSFFSFRFSILPLILSKAMGVFRFFGSPGILILGPRGEFSIGALKIRSLKKKIYISFFKALGLQKRLTWHASTEHELDDIERVFGAGLSIRTAVDISAGRFHFSSGESEPKKSDALRIVFVSRITEKKNLARALSMLLLVRKSVIFDVYGPIEDKDYWDKCLAQASLLPKNVVFSYQGLLWPIEVIATMAKYDLFYFPTFGENYGHVIAEAITAGLPVLISDQTPWRDLEAKNLGWDISLDRPNKFVEVIEDCCAIQSAEYAEWRLRIASWAKDNLSNYEVIEANRRLFSCAK
jgi:glycosyltransferase involved in cell wall biosynthesis